METNLKKNTGTMNQMEGNPDTKEKTPALTDLLHSYTVHLTLEEKNAATVKQYRRDILNFLQWLGTQKKEGGKEANGLSAADLTVGDLVRKTVLDYKEKLQNTYQATTANCKLAALNGFFLYLDRPDLKVKQFKIQRKTFCPKEKCLTQAEYDRLVNAAKALKNFMLALIIQTICATGIRVSELQFITVEMVQSGETTIQLKGKTRTLMLPRKLRRLLKEYIKEHGLTSGPVFVSGTGKPLDRTTIWRMMKSLCEKARVDPQKVYPHNLRHLFARVFYASTKDIVKLADILGHSRINTTRIYIISTGEEHQKLLDDLDLVS